ncbi:MAG: MFS transporter [Propionibacteriales bacterium]|nr:MFS transporter [Propionibacteriales bacterium]
MVGEPPTRRAATVWLVGLAILLLAFNLRPAVTSLGAVLDDVRGDLGLSATAAGVLTTLPVLCFAAFGAAAPGLARRFGARRVIVVSVTAIMLGLLVRALAGNAVVFFVMTGLALAGMATGNVLLPAIVKRYFPRRVGRMTGLYTTSIAVGTTAAAAVTVPVGEVVGGWRGGLLVWGVTAGVAVIPWVLVLRADHAGVTSRGPGPEPAVPVPRMARVPLAWALAVYFGSQSLQAYAAFGWLPQIYRDAGFDPATAGLLLAVVPTLGIPVALALPMLAARRPDQRPYVVVCVAAFAAGYLGLMTVPATLPWLWVVLLGIGGGAFPLALVMIGLRARTPEGTVRLSGFAQSIGYVVAASGPVALGLLYDVTGGWTAPIGLLIGLLVPQLIAGLFAARPVYVEDVHTRKA